VQNNLVHIKGGNLTLQDRQFVDKLISTTKADIYISTSPDINRDIKISAKINEAGQSSVLADTQPSDVKVNDTTQEFNLIRGKMRGRDTLKMGASSLKSKKGKLVVSIILAIIAMALFGFADTMACFNSAQNMYQTIQSSETKTFALKKVLNTKNYVDPESNYSYYDENAKATQEDLDAFRKKYAGYTFLPVYAVSQSLNYYKTDNITWYTSSYVSKGFYLTSEQYNSYGLNLLYGNYPTAADEIAITALQYECYKLTNLRDDTTYEEITINDYNDLIGKTIDGKTITGIIETHFPEAAQKAVLDKTSSYDMLSALNVQPLLESGFHYGIFYGAQPTISAGGDYVNWTYEKEGSSHSDSINFFITGNNLLTSENTVLKRSITALTGTQAIMCYYAEQYDGTKYRIDALDINEANSLDELRTALQTKFSNADEWDNYFKNAAIKDYYGNTDRPIEIVGVSFVTDSKLLNNSSRALFGITTKELGLSVARLGQYDSFITRLTGGNLDKDLVYSCADFGSTEDRFLIQNEASGFLKNFYNIIKTMAQVFLYIGLFFAVFATLLIMSFISNSIAYKKKEIGILRALGATGHDVYRIFTWESLIIVGIIFLISSVLVGVGAFAVNFALKTKAGLYLSLLSFGIRQIALLGGVCLLIGLVASWLPTRKISRMKPIDAIQERK
ncbi:MAG: FtsX-like permease family protein, partial [Clostridia bacterium]|nr:FtsX-like permease family protein [Clostridia bacterium]